VIIIGIDPGLTGACALLGGSGGDMLGLFDLPVARDHKRTWIDGRELRLRLLPGEPYVCRTFVEAVHAMPKQGVSSAFQFGCGFGSIIGCLQTLGMPIEFVPPTQWKKDLNLAREKSAALDKARLLFPAAELHLKKHDGRAEALLIAHWGYLKYRKDPHQ
jgi:crossover junction endodeoxyribonuclease RuvC